MIDVLGKHECSKSRMFLKGIRHFMMEMCLQSESVTNEAKVGGIAQPESGALAEPMQQSESDRELQSDVGADRGTARRGDSEPRVSAARARLSLRNKRKVCGNGMS